MSTLKVNVMDVIIHTVLVRMNYMSIHHAVFGDTLILVGTYCSTVKIYRNMESWSIYIEETKHHGLNMSVTNLLDTEGMQQALISLSPHNIYTGFSPDHAYRNDRTVGGFWKYDMDDESFTFIGMDDNDLMINLTMDVLSR